VEILVIEAFEDKSQKRETDNYDDENIQMD
jgi:hypothetical protein